MNERKIIITMLIVAGFFLACAVIADEPQAKEVIDLFSDVAPPTPAAVVEDPPDGVPVPVPDLVPNAEMVGGPVSDRLEKLFDRASGDMRANLQAQGRLIEQLTARLDEGREERQGILSRLNDIRTEANDASVDRRRLFSGIQEMMGSVRNAVGSVQNSVASFNPILNIVDRLIRLGWRLILLVLVFAVLWAILQVVIQWGMDSLKGGLLNLFRPKLKELK